MWASIIFQDWNQGEYTGEWSNPTLGVIRKRQSEKGSRFYYGGGATYCQLESPGKDYRIVKVYSGNEDAIYMQFHKDNPPLATSIKDATRERFNVKNGKNEPHLEGWLSPGGVYYECAYGSHNSYANRLAAFFFGELSYGYSVLLDMRWVAVHNDYIEPYDALLTAGQSQTLAELAARMGDVAQNDLKLTIVQN